jgi:hypothetical protein
MEQGLRQHNDFIISVAGPNIDTSIVTIEEMKLYCEQRKRIAIVGTQKKVYGEIDRLNYPTVMNYHKPKVLAVSSKNKPYLDVYAYLLDNFKTGLLIIETDTNSEVIIDMVCKSDKLTVNDIDVMVCREGFEAMSAGEIRKANLLRIHANPDINPVIFEKLSEFYGHKSLGIMLSQMYSNDQYNEVTAYMDKQNEVYGAKGYTDYVDQYELSKQISFFVYFDIVHNKILNISCKDLEEFIFRSKEQGFLPFPADAIPVMAKELTIF